MITFLLIDFTKYSTRVKLRKSIYFALETPVVCKINKPKKIKKWCKSFAKVLCVQKDLNGKYNIEYKQKMYTSAGEVEFNNSAIIEKQEKE